MSCRAPYSSRSHHHQLTCRHRRPKRHCFSDSLLPFLPKPGWDHFGNLNVTDRDGRLIVKLVFEIVTIVYRFDQSARSGSSPPNIGILFVNRNRGNAPGHVGRTNRPKFNLIRPLFSKAPSGQKLEARKSAPSKPVKNGQPNNVALNSEFMNDSKASIELIMQRGLLRNIS